MIKDAMAENAETTPNSRELAVLKEHFPGYFRKDGSFDVARFSDEVLRANGASPSQEGFGLDFLGKNYAKLIASLETETVIVPDEAHNSLPENQTSRNVYITGDNLDALKHLLKSYSGQVKCIYIDPPYNTGSDDFVYNDTFKFSADEIERKLGIDEEQARKLMSFTSKGSSSHSAWLTFMYPRLQLAKGLLANDGVIFISIDDNEQAQLKLIADSVFGEENFEGHIHWRRRHNQPNDRTKLIGLVAEHILVYSRDREFLKSAGVGKVALTGTFTNPDNDERGDWGSKPWKAGSDQSGTRYVITTPSGKRLDEEWMGDEETYLALLADKRIVFPRDGDGMPRKKYFLFEREQEGQCASNWWNHDAYGNNAAANDELTVLFNAKNIFSNPKPIKLIAALAELANLKNGDIALDFFSGSATTAHAVLNMNAKDGGNRRYIMVQWPEAVKENSEAAKAGYKTIDEIGQERIKRAAKKIREENPLFAGDLGFQHYTLKAVPQDTLDKLEVFDPEKEILEDATILAAFGKDTVLETWLVKDGYGFAADVQAVKLKDYTAYWCGRHLYLIEPGFTQDDVAELFKRYDTEGAFSPDHVVLFGYSFAAWSVREMLEINLRQLKDGAKNLQVNIDTRY